MSADSVPNAFQKFVGQWTVKQHELKKLLIEKDVHNWTLFGGEKERPLLNVVAGVDISFVKDEDVACACVTFLSFPDLKVIHTETEIVTMNLPYISGFLAFREVGFLVELYHKAVKATGATPGVIMVDGNGILHHRGFGIASHLGVLLDTPTVGVAKTFLMVDGLETPTVKKLAKSTEASEVLEQQGFFSVNLVGDSEKVWGAAVRPTKTTQNPIFVSIGHKVSLETAIELVRLTSRYRIPEPVRQADLLSREYLRGMELMR